MASGSSVYLWSSVKSCGYGGYLALEEQLGDGKDFTLVGYSAGSVVAIELATLLEASGRKGRLILIDGSPAFVASLLKAFDLSGSDADIENSVLIAVQESLVPGDLDNLQYFQMKTREEKCEYLESKIGRSGVHRKEYLVQSALDVVRRLMNLKYYERSTQQRLASKITLIKPRQPTVSDLTDDQFLSQEAPVVASMVVAEKRSLRKDNANIVDTVCSILGIRDQKCVSMNSSLTELGMDSMTAVEIKQTLEREFEVFLSAQELRGMTFGKLAALGSSSTAVSNVSNHPPAEAVDLSLLIQNVPPESETLVMIKSLKTASVTGDSVFFIPGLDGFISSFIPLAQNLDRPAFALSYPHQRPDVDSVAKTALVMLPALEEQPGDGKDFTLVGYSAGSVVAIELATLLEASGRKGRLILIDGSPAFVASLLKAFDLSGSDADIENSVLIAVQESLVPGDLDKLQYFQMKTREEKCEYLESKIGRSGVHRKEYLVQSALDVVPRLKNLKSYERSTQQRLASKITLIKPRLPTVSDLTDDQSLSVVSEEPVEVITVEGNHITMLSSAEMSITLKNILK